MLILASCAPRARVGVGESITCDGDWKKSSVWQECRCHALADDEPTPVGWTAASAVAWVDAAPPLTLATNDGLLESLGVSSNRCGIDTAKLRFQPNDSARFVECRSGSYGKPRKSLEMTGTGTLSLSGRVVEIPGSLWTRRDGFLTFMSASDEKPPVLLTADFQRGQASAVASPVTDGYDARSATFTHPPTWRKSIGAIASETFGQSLEELVPKLERREGWCLLNGVRSSKKFDWRPLGLTLSSLSDQPCSALGASAVLGVRGEGGAAVNFDVRINEDSPPSLIAIGSDTRHVPVPQFVASLLPCTASERTQATLSAKIAPVPGGASARVTLDWRQFSCTEHLVRCVFTAAIEAPKQ